MQPATEVRSEALSFLETPFKVSSLVSKKALGASMIVVFFSLFWFLGSARSEPKPLRSADTLPPQTPEPTALLGPIPSARPAPDAISEAPAERSVPHRSLSLMHRVEDPTPTSNLFSNTRNCWDGVQRTRNHSVVRYLTTHKISKRKGLTSIMLMAASMFAYASMDNRAVTFPKKSPVAMESLIDL
ncbi:membrane-associated protein, putative, partial [Bodo saltans]